MHVAFAALVAALAVPAAGVSKGNAVPTSIGKGEGELTLVAWEGYTEKPWVAPFEKQTGCKVTAKYAGSSDEMVNLMTLRRRRPVRHGLGLRRREPPADLRRRGRRGRTSS